MFQTANIGYLGKSEGRSLTSVSIGSESFIIFIDLSKNQKKIMVIFPF